MNIEFENLPKIFIGSEIENFKENCSEITLKKLFKVKWYYQLLVSFYNKKTCEKYITTFYNKEKYFKELKEKKVITNENYKDFSLEIFYERILF